LEEDSKGKVDGLPKREEGMDSVSGGIGADKGKLEV
jgi:hypothetical protein